MVSLDRITYNGTFSTPTVNLVTVKLHWNHINPKGENYDVMDIKYFYLWIPMVEYEYARKQL